VQDTNDLEGPGFGSIDDEVRIHGPETQRFVSEVFAEMIQARTLRQPPHGIAELGSN
jgi:hypothetical protein